MPKKKAGDGLTRGDRVAQHTAERIGSWGFIITQACLMAFWVTWNTLALTGHLHFDSYPFIFLNLAMSAEAAFATPLLLIAANVAAIRDRAQINRIESIEMKLDGHEREELTILRELRDHLIPQEPI